MMVRSLQADAVEALGRIRWGRTMVFLLLFAALGVNGLTFSFFCWLPSDRSEKAAPEKAKLAADVVGDPAEEGREIPDDGSKFTPAWQRKMSQWFHVNADWVLRGTLFAILAGGTLYVLLMLMGLKIVLMGRVPESNGWTSAMLWSLLLLVLLIPWQMILVGEAGHFGIPGIPFLEKELSDAFVPFVTEEKDSGSPGILLYARFLGYPAVGLLILLLTLIKSRQRYEVSVPTGGAAIRVPHG